MNWIKSSYSADGGACVETRRAGPDTIEVRDSKHPDGPVLEFNNQEWAAFVASCSAGEFDFPPG